MATDMSDVLIAWGKSTMFWVVVLVVILIGGSVLDHVYDWGVLGSVGAFLVDTVDVLKAALTGGML